MTKKASPCNPEKAKNMMKTVKKAAGKSGSSILARPFSELRQMFDKGINSLDESRTSNSQVSLEAIKALEKMHTNGKDPETDRRIEEEVIQISMDDAARDAEHAERVERMCEKAIAVALLILFTAFSLGGDHNEDGNGGVDISPLLENISRYLPSRRRTE